MRYKLNGYTWHTPGSGLGFTIFLILITILKNIPLDRNISETESIVFAITMFIVFLLLLTLGTKIYKKLEKFLLNKFENQETVTQITNFIEIFCPVVMIIILSIDLF